MTKTKTYLNWSSGKDSALALYHLQKSSNFEVSHLLTSVNSAFRRVSMHGLRQELLKLQLASIGLPYSLMELSAQPNMDEYEEALKSQVLRLKGDGHSHAAYGDIFLEDLKQYREKQLNGWGMNIIFPLWKRDTSEIIHEFIDLGFKAIVVAINSEVLDESFVGRVIDESFIADLPSNVDPCGENGEFHTFCYDGPIFDHPIAFQKGEKVFKEYKSPKQDDAHNNEKQVGYWFCDLLPD